MRDTYALTSDLLYRTKAASTLLGVTDTTLRNYSENAEIKPLRGSELNPKAPPTRIYPAPLLFKIAQWRRENGLTKFPERDRPFVMTVALQKGGVGKSVSAVETAVNLQLLGFRTLLIDLDGQGNATQLMGYEPDLSEEEAQQYDLSPKAIVKDTFNAVLQQYLIRHRRGHRTSDPIDAIKKPFGEHGPHLLPADTSLADAEQTLTASPGARELVLRDIINDSINGKLPFFDVRGYDVIVIDCAPSTSLLTSSALAAADLVLAPVRLDAFALKGLSRLIAELRSLENAYRDSHINPDLAIVPTHYAVNLSRTARMQLYLREHEKKLLPAHISSSEDFSRTLDNYLPVTLLMPTSRAAAEYRKVAELIRDKIIESSK